MPVGAAVGDLLDHPVQAGPVARHHADGGAFACQRERAATADAAAAAGDDGPLPVELQVHDGRRTPVAGRYLTSSFVSNSAGIVISITSQSSEYSSSSCLTPGGWYQASPASTRISPTPSKYMRAQPFSM